MSQEVYRAIRRRGDASICQKVWDAIKRLRHDRKSAAAENIIRFVNKHYNISEKEVEKELPKLVLDGLLVEKTAVVVKGANKGLEQRVLAIPDDSEAKFDRAHDWYCFQCHKAGEVIGCTTCTKVYHTHCLSKEETNLENFVCDYCKDCTINETPELDRGEINLLLSFTVARLESSFPMDFYVWNHALTSEIYTTSFTTDRSLSIANKKQRQNAEASSGIVDEKWRAKYLIHTDASLTKMNSRADRQVYKNFAQFRLDAKTIVHNVAIFHGEHSPMADSARHMHRTCLKELEEIKLCSDCYRRSNEQGDLNWFCEPCYPLHELVYAKAKSFPYWPAKVMGIAGDKYDVRFFGTCHERAKLDKSFVKPIDTDINALVTKRSAAWVRAMEELKLHQKMVAEMSSSEDEGEEVKRNDTVDDLNMDSETSTLPIFKNLRITVDRLTKTEAPISQSQDLKNLEEDAEAACLSKASNQPGQDTLDEVIQFYKEELKDTIETVNQLRREIDLLKENHSSEIKSLKENLTQLANERDSALAESKTNSDENSRLLAVVRSQSEELASLKERLEASKPVPGSHEKEIQIAIDMKEEEIKTLRCQKQKEMELMRNRFEEEIKKIKEDCDKEIQANKKKHWCSNCWKEGIYLCCSNISYCSTTCQHEHWVAVHKKTCVRKKNEQRREVPS